MDDTACGERTSTFSLVGHSLSGPGKAVIHAPVIYGQDSLWFVLNKAVKTILLELIFLYS